MGEVEEEIKQTRRRPPPAVNPTTTTTTTTIPFRPRKLRKLTTTTNKKDPALTLPPVLLLSRPLTSPGEIAAAIDHLRLSDPLLTSVIASHDPPSFTAPLPPFHSLARSILYQQLSPKAASTIYTRFLSLFSISLSLSPSSVLSLSPQALRAAGVSARKASYLHDLALKFHSDVLSEDKILASSDDGSLMSALTAVRGIGPWSVHMFMIFSLHSPDVLPVGDLGVRKGVQVLYGLDKLPNATEMEGLCESWRPYRSVGAWYMWRLAESTLSGTFEGKGTGSGSGLGSGSGSPH